jgi:hypothetical protein
MLFHLRCNRNVHVPQLIRQREQRRRTGSKPLGKVEEKLNFIIMSRGKVIKYIQY